MSINGLILSGGTSSRMGYDKGSLSYDLTSNESQRLRCFRLLKKVCSSVYISCKKDQAPKMEKFLPCLLDSIEGRGPAIGIVSAHRISPETPWLVVACD